MIITLNIVFPIMIYLFVGIVCNKIKIVSENTVAEMNKVIFRVLFPSMVFYNIYSADLKSDLNVSLLMYISCAVISLFFILMIGYSIFIEDKKRRGSLIQGVFRSNPLVFGLPIISALYEGQFVAMLTISAAILIPIFNIFTVIMLEIYGGNKVSIIKLIKQLIKNPLIISSIVGIIFAWTEIGLPVFITNALKGMANAVSPVSLILLGSTLKLKELKNHFSHLAVVSLLKLIICPGVIIFVAYICGFRDGEIAVLFSLFAVPTAVSSYTMARELNSDYVLSGEIVVATSTFAIITIYLGLNIMNLIGIIIL